MNIKLNFKKYFLVYANTSNYILLIIIEVIRRLCNLYEEKNHISSRYDEKRSILLKEIVSINKYNLVFLPVAVMITLFAPAGTLYSIETYGVFSWICSLIGVTLLSEIINMVNYFFIHIFNYCKIALAPHLHI